MSFLKCVWSFISEIYITTVIPRRLSNITDSLVRTATTALKAVKSHEPVYVIISDRKFMNFHINLAKIIIDNAK